MKFLFKEFSPVSSQQWKEQIVKDLKGLDPSKLIWENSSGIKIAPFYNSENLKEKPTPLFTHANWDCCVLIEVVNEKQANSEALKALEGGASGLTFFIDKKIDTSALLKNISLEHIYSQFFISNDALNVLTDLKKYYGKINEHDGKLKCFVNIDPLCLYAFWGEWHASEEKDLEEITKLVHIPVNVSLYNEAGACAVNELAIGLAHTNEYFNYLEDRKALKDKTLHFSFSASADFFGEIAKFRAFRKLVALLQQQYKTNFPLHIHAETSRINQSSLDAYTNMLRTTTEGMSAAIGGCDSIAVLPYNITFERPDDFANRIALNQQHILKEESYLNKVADIGAGSYYIENLTEQLAEKAWEQFKVIESKGGFIACLKNNFIQDLIAEDAKELLEQVKDGKMVLVGVNKFQNPKEVQSSVFVVRSSGPKSKTDIKRIIPIRLAESFEKEKSTNSQQPTKA